MNIRLTVALVEAEEARWVVLGYETHHASQPETLEEGVVAGAGEGRPVHAPLHHREVFGG